MAQYVVLDVVLRLEEHLENKFIRDEIDIDEVCSTLTTIHHLAIDAENRVPLNSEARDWLISLKNVLYELEERFEDIILSTSDGKNIRISSGAAGRRMHTKNTLRNICMKSLIKKGATTNRPKMNNVSHIRLLLKGIAARVEEGKQYFSCDAPVEECQPYVLKNGEQKADRETFILTMEDKLIGRQHDLQRIKDLLLGSSNDVEDRAFVIPIIGMDGVGKTTLAQHVLNDYDIIKHFDLIGWVTISGVRSLEELTRKTLKSLTRSDCHHPSKSLQEVVNQKKFLLVVDDLQDEDYEKFQSLRALLSSCEYGSKVVVTTISEKVTEMKGTVKPYKLEGLSKEDSWNLLTNLVQLEHGHEHLTKKGKKIGEDIVDLPLIETIIEISKGHPLAIKSIAGVLSFEEAGDHYKYLGKLKEVENGNIMSILKLNFDCLPSQLKQCFAYCSLFPMGDELDKIDLINLWMAQGFITPPKGSTSPQDVGHGYFLELLGRSFLELTGKDMYGEITKCKLHNCMKKLAIEIAEDECLVLGEDSETIDARPHHVSFTINSSQQPPFSTVRVKRRVRTLQFFPGALCLGIAVHDMNIILSDFSRLRALDLGKVDCYSFPSFSGELKHLRYLKLGGSLEMFPECIRRMRFLQTLDLRACFHLRELPDDFNPSKSLTSLYVKGVSDDWEKLPDLSMHTSLQALDVFIVGKDTGLDELANLNNLTGRLEIRFHRHDGKATRIPGLLKGTKLTGLELNWPSCRELKSTNSNDTALQQLQPPNSLRSLQIRCWMGKEFTKWKMQEFTYLSFVEIKSCNNCDRLPLFRQLPHLRSLELWNLRSLEYIETPEEVSSAGTGDIDADITYFPSLQRVELRELPKLKGWSAGSQQSPPLLCSELTIIDCPEFTLVPSLPNLKAIHLHSFHKKLLKHIVCQQLHQLQHPPLQE